MARHWWSLIFLVIAAALLIGLALFIATGWAEEPPAQKIDVGQPAPFAGMLFPQEKSRRLLDELDQRDHALAEVEALKSLVDRYEALMATDKKLLEAQDQLIAIKDRVIQAHEEEVAYLRKRLDHEEPGLFAKLWQTGKVSMLAAGGAVVGSAFGPIGAAVGAVVGVVMGGGL